MEQDFKSSRKCERCGLSLTPEEIRKRHGRCDLCRIMDGLERFGRRIRARKTTDDMGARNGAGKDRSCDRCGLPLTQTDIRKGDGKCDLCRTVDQVQEFRIAKDLERKECSSPYR